MSDYFNLKLVTSKIFKAKENRQRKSETVGLPENEMKHLIQEYPTEEDSLIEKTIKVTIQKL